MYYPVMRLSEGVEWGLHCCLALAWIGGDKPVPTAKLAGLFELPPTYLNKHLQALARAGVLESRPGARGGFSLARRPSEITFMDVVAAIDGSESAFRCDEIRMRGAGATAPARDFRRPCGIATAMRTAELAWRRELAAQTVADMIAKTPRATADRLRRHYELLRR
jgi:Rrf2 family protein